MKLLLLSNSTLKGEPYLGWPQLYLKEFLQSVRTVIFVPYAGITISYDDYTNLVSKALASFNINIVLRGIHTINDKQKAIAEADCIMIGGGNTFSLLNKLQEEQIAVSINQAVKNGSKYVGWSAGANMACPTIKTTNDMPIEQPQSFNALGLINFQINPHFTNATIPNHGGESRKMRLQEYLVRNPTSVIVGLPEGMLIEVDGENYFIKGEGEALLFRHNQLAKKLPVGVLELV